MSEAPQGGLEPPLIPRLTMPVAPAGWWTAHGCLLLVHLYAKFVTLN